MPDDNKQAEEKPQEKEQPKEEVKTEEKPEEKKEASKEEEVKPKEEPPKEKAKPKPKPIKKDYKLKTVSEKKNPLMKRTEYMFQVVHSAQPTPVRVDLTKEIAKVLKVKEDGILVEKIFSERGRAESSAKVFVYKDRKDIPKHKLDKIEKRINKKKGDEAKAEPPKDAPVPKPAEKPKEAPKEESKPEEKPDGEKKE